MLRGLNLEHDPRVIVGIETGDDAGVCVVAPGLALVQTVDFFTPIVDDPRLFGEIAAANALSDVYAMGGTPLSALNIVCWPTADRGIDELAEVLRGAAGKVLEAGAALLGGHSVDDPEPKFGMSVTGLIDPARVATNRGAVAGDLIILTKPIGSGIIATAARYDACPADSFDAAVAYMRRLNAGAAAAMRAAGIGPGEAVHAATDITGFGLVGHLGGVAAASGVSIHLDSLALPLIPGVLGLAEAGYLTRGDSDTRAHLGDRLVVGSRVPASVVSAALDPQTSGGLAIFVRQDSASRVCELLAETGDSAMVIGHAGIHRPGTVSLE